MAERFAEVGAGVVVRPPFHCDYGFNIRLGANAFLNYNCVILDVAEVSIGEGAQIGPAVQIYAADHPRDAAQRRAGVEFGRPVRIGKHAWIGGGAIVLPGISIGTTRWSAPAASSRGICRRARRSPATPRELSAHAGSMRDRFPGD